MTKDGTVRSSATAAHRGWPGSLPSEQRRLVAVLMAACSSGTPTADSGGSNAAVVQPPDFTLQGCTYVLDSTIPAGEPQGVKPQFPSFSPDQSATAALEGIKAHGGTAMVDSVSLPAGTTLRSGPDTGQSVVGTVPSGYSILAAEPVVWTDHSGAVWLAFFLSCGGGDLYWVSVPELTHQNAAAGKQVAAQIDALRAAPPYIHVRPGVPAPHPGHRAEALGLRRPQGHLPRRPGRADRGADLRWNWAAARGSIGALHGSHNDHRSIAKSYRTVYLRPLP